VPNAKKPSGRLLASGRSMILVIASVAGSRAPAEKDAAAAPCGPGGRPAVTRFWFATHGSYPGAPGVTGQPRGGTGGFGRGVPGVTPNYANDRGPGLAGHRAGR